MDRISLSDIKIYVNKQPELRRILSQLEIDEEAYFEALNEITEEEQINVQPIANSTYFGE